MRGTQFAALVPLGVVAACSGQQASDRARPAGPAMSAAELADARAYNEPERCAGCHPGPYAEWSRSRHAAAWRDPIFQSEYARGESPWCVGCHAPLAPDRSAPADDDSRVAQGVGCAACHVRDGQLVSRTRAEDSPHGTIADGTFGSADACASCHEFNFPILDSEGRFERYTDEPMQATVSQYRQSGLDAALECNDCHALSEHGHAFPGSHQPEMILAALKIDLCRTGDSVRMSLLNRGAAHNVPSGGVHRRMVMRMWRSSDPTSLVERELGRRFRPRPDGGKVTVADTTIEPGATAVLSSSTATLGGYVGEPINAELRYIYALDETTRLPGAVTARSIWRTRALADDLPACDD